MFFLFAVTLLYCLTGVYMASTSLSAKYPFMAKGLRPAVLIMQNGVFSTNAASPGVETYALALLRVIGRTLLPTPPRMPMTMSTAIISNSAVCMV